MHAGGRISNIWLGNKSIPSVRKRSSLWPSGYLLFLSNELHGIFCWRGKTEEDKGKVLVKMICPVQDCPRPCTTNLKSYTQPSFYLFHCLLTYVMFSLHTTMTRAVSDDPKVLLLLISIGEYLFSLLCVHEGYKQPL